MLWSYIHFVKFSISRFSGSYKLPGDHYKLPREQEASFHPTNYVTSVVVRLKVTIVLPKCVISRLCAVKIGTQFPDC